MGIDIIDIGWFHTCVFQCRVHHILGAKAFGMRGSNMMCIGCCSATGDLAINFCSSLYSMLQVLEHHYASGLTHNEAIAVLVIRPAGCFGIFIAFTERLHGIEPTYSCFADHTLGTPAQDNIGHA